jgi:hypothetical protein
LSGKGGGIAFALLVGWRDGPMQTPNTVTAELPQTISQKISQMTNQKTSTEWAKRLAMAALAVAGLAGCGNKDSGTQVAVGRTGRLGPGAASAVNGQLSGIMYGDDQGSFQYAVEGLVSAQIDETSLGQVSAQAAGGTGVFFGGRVFVNGTTANGTIASNSSILIVVKDSLVGTTDPSSGRAVTPVEIGLSQATGQVSNGQVSIEFQDSMGVIILEGVINGQTFTGTVSYDNARSVNGGPGASAEPMASFQIPTCQFFVCQ